MSLLIRALILSDQGPTLLTSFNFTTSLKAQPHWSLGLQHMSFGGTQTEGKLPLTLWQLDGTFTYNWEN